LASKSLTFLAQFFCFVPFLLYFCGKNDERMAVTDSIISFAVQKGGSFKKKDLLEALRTDAAVNDASLSAILGRMVATGRLVKTGWGEYALPEGTKPRFLVRPREEALVIGQALHERYPLVDFCIWDSFCVVPFMLHVPNVNITVVDVERDMESTFFDALKEMFPQYSVLPHPTKEEFYTYGDGKDSIVIHPLYTESRLEAFAGLRVPMAEKVLVDIAVNPEFDYLQGSEVYTIYENAFRSCSISRSALLRYARRRSCTLAIQIILSHVDQQDHD
jgi:hypothetical protein